MGKDPPGPDPAPASDDATMHGGEYRHPADLRLCLPSWLGGIYVDLRVGRDRRTGKRTHVVPRRVLWTNRAVLAVIGQMAAAWGIVAACTFYWVTQSACGVGVQAGSVESAAVDETRAIRGTSGSYVAPSGHAQAKTAAASALIDLVCAPEVGRTRDEVALYFADSLQIAEDPGRRFDACALPLGRRIVMLRAFVEEQDPVTISVLYVHELHHMRQPIDVVGTRAGEQQAREVEKAYRESYTASAGSSAYYQWVADHSEALGGDGDAGVAARASALALPPDGALQCGVAR